jgi:hypothetical protein
VVYADEWSRGRNYSTVPVAVKAALLAFKETLSFVYASETYDSVPLPVFSVEIVDTMCNSALGISADCDAMTDADVTTLINGAMEGGRLGCSHMPEPSIVIGGTNRPSVIDEVLTTATSKELPNLGFRSWEGDTNATNYTWFSRINPSSTKGATLTVSFLEAYSVTSFMLWYCDDVEGAEVAAAVQDAASSVGMRVTLAALQQGGDSTSWSAFATTATDEGIYDHVVAVDETCDVTGLLTYLGSDDAGMMTSDYLWVGLYPSDTLWTAYEADYNSTTFPMDAFTVIQEPLESNTSTEMDSWWSSAVSSGDDIEDWVVDFMGSDTSFGTKSSEVLELWRQERNATSAANGGVRDNYLFDAVYAAQLAAWSALSEYGSANTGWKFTATAAELQQKLLAVDFEGLTGSIQFESSGDRLLTYEIAQYQS